MSAATDVMLDVYMTRAQREAYESILAKSAAYDALVARVEAAPVVTAGSWIRNYMATANRIEYGSRVRLLLVREGGDGN